MDNGVRVLLEEEYGYRYWIWDTLMVEEELIEWFKTYIGKDDTVFSDPRNLHGRRKLVNIGDFKRAKTEDTWLGMFNDADDSYLISPKGIKYDIGS